MIPFGLSTPLPCRVMRPPRSLRWLIVALCLVAAACGSDETASNGETRAASADTSDGSSETSEATADPETSDRDEAQAPAQTVTTTPEDSSAGTDPSPVPEAPTENPVDSEPPAEETRRPPLGPRTPPELSPEPDFGTTTRAELFAIAFLPDAIALTQGSTDSLFVATQNGMIYELLPAGSGTYAEPVAVLDLSPRTQNSQEEGLLGITFSPDGNHFYAMWTDRESGANQLAEFVVSDGRIDGASERLLMTVEQPYPNHNGGHIAFGPDGFLYIGLGDGGAGGDPQGHGQNLDTLLGSILRIDPRGNNAGAYGIPADNPFVNGGGRPEIWLYGLRNPWRFSFDRQTGDLWIGDVGQNQIEEITRVTSAQAGGNLGWALFEGTRSFDGGTATDRVIPPAFEYSHGDGNLCSVTGGFVYRGSEHPGLSGSYLWGDFCEGRIRALRVDAAGVLFEGEDTGATVPERSLASFGEDREGELYVLAKAGTVARIVEP